jgi:minor extracellular serine protease Vpr
VANFSLNTNAGPHDGTEAQERTLDSLFPDTSRGRFITLGSGNDGCNLIHTQAKFGAGVQTDSVELMVRPYPPQPGRYNDALYLDLWYRGAGTLTVTVLVYDTLGALLANLGAFPFTLNPNQVAFNGAPNTGYIEIYNYRDAANNQNRVYAIIYDGSPDTSAASPVYNPAVGTWKFRLQRSQFADTGAINGWYLGSSSSIRGAWAVPDSFYQVGSPSTSRRGCGVGELVVAEGFTSITGTPWPVINLNVNPELDTAYPLGQVAPYSSRGPTVDGRIKPDFTAPGLMLPSPRSQWFRDTVLTLQDSNYFAAGGTSVSAPVTAGLVALLLEAKPTLMIKDIFDSLKVHALVDAQTGTVPNNRYGYGKAHLDFASLYPGMVSTGQPDREKPLSLAAFPNPFNPATMLEVFIPPLVPTLASIELLIFDVQGRLVEKIKPPAERRGCWLFRWQPVSLASGLYLARVQAGALRAEKTILLLK